jgi:hypothetical protein
VHIINHVNLHITGTATSGTAYVGNQEASLIENLNSGGTDTITEPLSFEVISQGSAPNFLFHLLLHETINPDGTVTSFIDTFTTECKG